MEDETWSDHVRLCHPGAWSGGSVPDGTWCQLVTELWWAIAKREPEKAAEAIHAAGFLPRRVPGQRCPVADCDRAWVRHRRDGGDDPPLALPRPG